MKPFSGGKGRDEGHCLPPAKLARPLRILAETGPAMSKEALSHPLLRSIYDPAVSFTGT
jgi:hypothetical protein